MQRNKEKKNIRFACSLLAGLFLTGSLCGCTKKEELLLTDGGLTAEREAESVLPEGEAQTALSMDGGIAEQETETAFSDGGDGQAAPGQEGAVSVCVHVCGAVKKPGVYELSVGSRVYEAVQAAGGFTAEADQDYVNQAQTLPDGVKLVIPTAEEAAAARAAVTDGGERKAEDGSSQPALPAGGQMAAGIITEGQASGQESGQTASASDGKININTASEAELCNIPGIGATRAAAIAAYRDSHGGFKKPEDIMQVNGIKEGMYEKIKDSIRVN